MPEVLKSNKLSVANRALTIIAEEVGLQISDLVPTADFSDFGVDSLLSLNIAGRFREELDIEVEASLFSDCPTVKDLLAFLPGGSEPIAPAFTPSSVATTPELENLSTATSTTDDTDYSIIETEEVLSGEESTILATIRLSIAKEVGIPLAELTGTLSFSDIGMDSLLSLNVLGKLREVLDLELDSAIFADNDTLNEIQAALGLAPKSATITPLAPAPVAVTTIIKAVSHPPASSILLQGSSKSASKILFLFPDGSGSATSYAPLPKISSDLVVYGLNCPYMRTPELMKCSLEELTPSYVTEIRRRQPAGPYSFGGWSAGGICAFDAAQTLASQGEIVERLILIDSPFPIGLEKLPPRLYEFFSSIGMFSSPDNNKPPPSWLLPHFLAFVDSLDLYRAKPFAPGMRKPKTSIIWARDGVCKDETVPRPQMRESDPKEMKWLLNNRTDFSSNGWDSLIGEEVDITTMEDANHFTMMEGEKVRELAGFIKGAMMA